MYTPVSPQFYFIKFPLRWDHKHMLMSMVWMSSTMLALTYELNYILPKVLLAAEKKTFRVILFNTFAAMSLVWLCY